MHHQNNSTVQKRSFYTAAILEEQNIQIQRSDLFLTAEVTLTINSVAVYLHPVVLLQEINNLY